MELCIECTRHCHGSSFPKLGGGETAHGRHTRVDVDAVMCAGVGPDGKPARTAEYAAPQWPVCGHAASVAGKTANGRQMPSHTSANARSISGGESRTRSATPSHEKGGQTPSVSGGETAHGRQMPSHKKEGKRPVACASAPSVSGGETAHGRQMPSHKKEGKRPVASANAPSISGGETAHGRQMPIHRRGQAPNESEGHKRPAAVAGETAHCQHTSWESGGVS